MLRRCAAASASARFLRIDAPAAASAAAPLPRPPAWSNKHAQTYDIGSPSDGIDQQLVTLSTRSSLEDLRVWCADGSVCAGMSAGGRYLVSAASEESDEDGMTCCQRARLDADRTIADV
eukprot:TRINITY_DN8122_c0_g1_i1.p1 TRINITY_DN8122_c0_g1~~TRINITY_DN8122_c0_g1_i1.p1  ORF type:complete len:119 (+),score=29.02 TRINITY_DN8122_c0_g1_i1:596-952(+)